MNTCISILPSSLASLIDNLRWYSTYTTEEEKQECLIEEKDKFVTKINSSHSAIYNQAFRDLSWRNFNYSYLAAIIKLYDSIGSSSSSSSSSRSSSSSSSSSRRRRRKDNDSIWNLITYLAVRSGKSGGKYSLCYWDKQTSFFWHKYIIGVYSDDNPPELVLTERTTALLGSTKNSVYFWFKIKAIILKIKSIKNDQICEICQSSFEEWFTVLGDLLFKRPINHLSMLACLNSLLQYFLKQKEDSIFIKSRGTTLTQR